MIRCDRYFVISGCSGSEKSTLLSALRVAGNATVEEPGRRIVQDQIRRGGDALPWTDPQRFPELRAELAISDFDARIAVAGRVFFDRSFIDVAAALLNGRRAASHG